VTARAKGVGQGHVELLRTRDTIEYTETQPKRTSCTKRRKGGSDPLGGTNQPEKETEELGGQAVRAKVQKKQIGKLINGRKSSQKGRITIKDKGKFSSRSDVSSIHQLCQKRRQKRARQRGKRPSGRKKEQNPACRPIRQRESEKVQRLAGDGISGAPLGIT